MEPVYRHALLMLAAAGAGVINVLAGGGTLLTFPSLVRGGGLEEVVANATSTVALVPGSLAGAWGFRRELRGTGPWLALLVGPSLVGGLIGALLLTRLSNQYFVLVVPWLLLTAALLFLLQPTLARHLPQRPLGGLPAPALCVAVAGFQLLVAIYGGYFGAGIGILMLSALGLMGLGDIHRMNAVKNLLGAGINGISVVVFVLDDKVSWRYVPGMVLAAIAGGYLGARFGRFLPGALVRWIVIVIGLALSAYYFARQAGVLSQE
jgi:uncharacterized membrane protein YfcA